MTERNRPFSFEAKRYRQCRAYVPDGRGKEPSRSSSFANQPITLLTTALYPSISLYRELGKQTVSPLLLPTMIPTTQQLRKRSRSNEDSPNGQAISLIENPVVVSGTPPEHDKKKRYVVSRNFRILYILSLEYLTVTDTLNATKTPT